MGAKCSVAVSERKDSTGWYRSVEPPAHADRRPWEDQLIIVHGKGPHLPVPSPSSQKPSSLLKKSLAPGLGPFRPSRMAFAKAVFAYLGPR